MASEAPKKVLVVGLACLDVVHVVSAFPVEDTDQRSLEQYSSRGGNASNSCTVLSELGEPCEYFGTLAEGTLEQAKMQEDFDRCGINTSHCPRIVGKTCPNSCVIVSAATGSRTIVHTNVDLPELSPADLARVDLSNYDWVHFEGRNVDAVTEMIAAVMEERKRRGLHVVVSVEVEKVNRGHEVLLPLADVCVVSKDVAKSHGAADMDSALAIMSPRMRSAKEGGALLVCPWGEDGAAAMDLRAGAGGKKSFSRAFPPKKVVDTVGAGDTFNAALISALRRSPSDVDAALEAACRVAGAKQTRSMPQHSGTAEKGANYVTERTSDPTSATMASSSAASTSLLSSSRLSQQQDLFLNETALLVEAMRLNLLTKAWSRETWESQFTEARDPPEEFRRAVVTDGAGDTLARAMADMTDLALKWLEIHTKKKAAGEDGDEEDQEAANRSTASSSSIEGGYWPSMIRRGIRYKRLIALLFYLLDRGQRLDAHPYERDQCTRAASLYFVLLSLPGSGAFSVFHPVLFNKALDTFKLTTKLRLVRFSPKKKKRGGGRKGPGSSASQQVGRPRRRHASRASSTCSSGVVGAGDDGDDSDPELDPSLIPQSEIQSLTSSLNSALYHFLVFLDHCPLKRSAESLESAAQELSELARLETEFASLDFGRRGAARRSGLSALAFNGYIGLEKLCSPLHGDPTRTSALVLRQLLPAVMMTTTGRAGGSEVTPRGLTVIREHALHFVKHLMTTVGEPCFESVLILIQHVALRVPDRAEFRHKAASAVVELMRGLPAANFKSAVRWIVCWAHNEKAAARQFAVEVMGRLLQENEREQGEDGPGEEDAECGRQAVSDQEEGTQEEQQQQQQQMEMPSSQDQDLVSHKFIFGVVFSRCRDVSATVRARALQTLAEITAANNPTMRIVIRNLLGGQEGEDRRQEEENAGGRRKTESGMIDFVDLLSDPSADLASIDPLPPTDAFMDFLRRRALDESVYVRKNALQVLDNILRTGLLSEDIVSVLVEHCCDSSLMVRKLMVASLTDITRRNPDSDLAVGSWVRGVFPLILDVEQKAAEKVHEAVWECLFRNLKTHADTRSESDLLPWRILHHVKVQKMTKYLSRACGTWAKEGLLKGSVLNLLKTHVNTENNEHSWLLLSLVTVHLPLQDPHFVMEYFNTSIHRPEGVSLYTLLQVLRVLFASVIRLSRQEQHLLQKDLVLLVARFALPPELIPTAVDIATVISDVDAGGEKSRGTDAYATRYRANLEGWAVEIIENIDDELSSKILNPAGDEFENVRMMRQIFTLGELAQICPSRINKRLFLLMQSIIFQEGSKHRKGGGGRVPSSQTQSTQPPPCAFTPTVRLQAVSIVTLAKMCLQQEDMAKKMVPAFGRLLLESSSSPDSVAIKNNVMYALTDMCVRYASLVDPLIPQMTACLKDPSLVVRTTTLITLIHLLQEDYLKMSGRGTFFFRILQTLNDESEEIRRLTTFYIQQRLLKRKPKVMYANFIEAIFHFNEYEGHQRYNKFAVSDREKTLFSLSGPEHRAERSKLYKFMLENMTDEDRFQTTYKLCQDILNGAVEGQIAIDGERSHGLLQDTLACLASEDIKLASLRSKQDEDEAAEAAAAAGLEDQQDAGVRGALMVAAKKTIISQVVKKNYIENTIPIVIALKHRLEAARSPLLSDLMSCLRELMKDYKNEVKDMLAADRQLAAEIEFDLRKWEEEQKKQEEEHRREQMASSSSQTPREQENEQLIRVFLETAVTAIKERIMNAAERRKSRDHQLQEGEGDARQAAMPGLGRPGGGDDDEAGAAEEGDDEEEGSTPLQAFLESNHALEGDGIPEDLPHMLSPNVRLEDISGRLKKRRKSGEEEGEEAGVSGHKRARKRLVLAAGGEQEVAAASVAEEGGEASAGQEKEDSPEEGEEIEAAGGREAEVDRSEVEEEDDGGGEDAPGRTNDGEAEEENAEAGERVVSSGEGQGGGSVQEGEQEGKDGDGDEAADRVSGEAAAERTYDRGDSSRVSGKKRKADDDDDGGDGGGGQQQQQPNKLRAISTPNKSVLAGAASGQGANVTFLERSADLSAIPVLSPPTAKKSKKPEKRRGGGGEEEEDLSFKFRRGGRDLFEEMVRKDQEQGRQKKKPEGEEGDVGPSRGEGQRTTEEQPSLPPPARPPPPATKRAAKKKKK